MFLAYEVLLYLVLILSLPVFLVLRGRSLANVPERLGIYRTPAQSHDLWLHAVSVGETIAARPVMAAIERLRPQTSVVITTTTVTGQTQAKQLFPNATVTYFPFDFSFSVRRFLDHHRPRAFATMETEIWPNVLRIAKSRGLRLLLANGRLSDRSFPRYRLARPLLRRVLRFYDRILAREELDRERFMAVGARKEIVETSGNVKFVTSVSGKCLDVNGAGSADGTNIQEWTCNGTGAQSFRLEDMGGGNVRLVNANSNKFRAATRAVAAHRRAPGLRPRLAAGRRGRDVRPAAWRVEGCIRDSRAAKAGSVRGGGGDALECSIRAAHRPQHRPFSPALGGEGAEGG